MNNLTAETNDYSDGEIIFAEFERGDKFYIIQSGKVELIRVIGNVTKTLDVLQPNEMFGEMALLDDSLRSATAIAVGNTKLTCFGRGNFEDLVMSNPNIAFKLLRTFVRRIYDAKRRFMILTLDEPNARVADVFLMLEEGRLENQLSSKTIGNVKEFQVSIESIARWSGLETVEAKNSVMYYQKLGYLEMGKDTIVVKDINNFIRIVNSARAKLLRQAEEQP